MTENEFYAKYGNVKVKFSSYYKYTFYFVGFTDDGNRVVVEMGGNSDEIYRESVVADEEFPVHSLAPYAGTVYEGNNNIKVIDSFYNY